MSYLADRRPAAAEAFRVPFLLAASAGSVPAAGVPLAPRRLLGWVAAAGALPEPGAPARPPG